MSIATELIKLNTNLSNAYQAIENKGGTIPETKTMHNLSSAIDSIQSGGSDFTSEDFIKGYFKEVDGVLMNNNNNPPPEKLYGITISCNQISGGSALSTLFKGNNALSSFEMPNLSVILPKNTYIFTQAFKECKNLNYVKIPNLKTLDGVTFYNGSMFINSGIVSVDMRQLSATKQEMFGNCKNLKHIEPFESENFAIAHYSFRGCQNLDNTDFLSNCISVINGYASLSGTAISSFRLENCKVYRTSTTNIKSQNDLSGIANLREIDLHNVEKLQHPLVLPSDCENLNRIRLNSYQEPFTVPTTNSYLLMPPTTTAQWSELTVDMDQFTQTKNQYDVLLSCGYTDTKHITFNLPNLTSITRYLFLKPTGTAINTNLSIDLHFGQENEEIIKRQQYYSQNFAYPQNLSSCIRLHFDL